MKNYNFYISLYIIIAAALSSCAVTKKQAPIEYHHSNSNLEDSRSVNENTVSIISNDGEIISSKSEINIDDTSEIIKPTPHDENHILPASKPTEDNYKIIEHQVKKNETIQEIAINYEQTVYEIAQTNDLQPPYDLDEDDIIKIKVPKDFALKTKLTTEIKEEPIKQVQVVPDYIIPVEGTIINKFGEKTDHGINKGVNISAPQGATVVASASGKVIYADYDATFGNLVIIKLDNKNIVLSYSHLEELTVKKDTHLKQGDIVGYIGTTGKIKQPQLHFAVREGKNAVDPLKFVNYNKN
jgi:hypothetical protein